MKSYFVNFGVYINGHIWETTTDYLLCANDEQEAEAKADEIAALLKQINTVCARGGEHENDEIDYLIDDLYEAEE